VRHILFLACILWFVPVLKPAETPYTSLMLYSGTWKVSRKDSPKPSTMVNDCVKVGRFYTCDQSVDGGLSALLIFIPRADQPGHYYTQNVRPEGRATNRGDLEIKGNVWTFLSNWDSGGATTFYKTVDTFVGKTRITYEQFESSNDRDWKLLNSGEQTRAAGKR
jgi:hypothetical protein